jgi:hypothetical protein
MAPSSFQERHPVRRDVLISDQERIRSCQALIDADLWPPDGMPVQMGGFLDLPRAEWEALAGSLHLVLTLAENGERYRMILDANNGRFIARRL